MRRALGAAIAALALAAPLPAFADWSFSDDKQSLMLEDDDSGLMFLDFTCRNGELTADYSTIDDELDALPVDASVRLNVSVDSGRRMSFSVVADDKEGSTYGLGDRDAPTLWSLVADGGVPFTADLRSGKSIFWRAHFDREGYDTLKDQLPTFCPEPKPQ
ncbi:MAG: hypothetical protein WDM84_00580 [Bauldia sp.]